MQGYSGSLQANYFRRATLLLLVMLAVCAAAVGSRPLAAQPPPAADTPAEETPAGPSGTPVPGDEQVAESGDTGPAALGMDEQAGIQMWTLIRNGGVFMIPIAVMSMLVVTFVVERLVGLRRRRVLPPKLVAALGRLGGPDDTFDPRRAYQLCQQFPSAAASVIRAMLLKVGRPHSEVEHTVMEVSQREADRLYANVRWLNLAAAVSPLLGLLGTVAGLIRAFHDTTRLLPGQNKADYLAKGIYEALVTTLAGLLVAIPAAIFAHYFEGRIQKLFHEIDELLFNLLPQIERYEGRVRFTRSAAEGEATRSRLVEPPPAPEQTAAGSPK